MQYLSLYMIEPGSGIVGLEVGLDKGTSLKEWAICPVGVADV